MTDEESPNPAAAVNVPALAETYAERPSEQIGAECKAMLNAVSEALFQQIPVRVEWTDYQPYNTFAELKRDIEQFGRLRQMRGYDSPIFGKAYAKFRAVHDYFDHYKANIGFGVANEAMSFGIACTRYPAQCWPALYCELVLGNAYAEHNGERAAEDKYIVP